MKPESKKNRANSNKSDGNKGNKKSNASCYDLTKLSEALDIVEGKSTKRDANTQFMVKQSDSNSSFDLTKLSEELSAVEEEDKKVAELGCKVEKRKGQFKLRHMKMCFLALELLNVLDSREKEVAGSGSGPGIQPQRILPILSRLQRIVKIVEAKRKGMMSSN